ncbi:MAG: hypothetical protein SW833_23950 [Cyanobacteriota bacterium]|nr:hypothetical protein [Cyanobacteriota bacterium]
MNSSELESNPMPAQSLSQQSAKQLIGYSVISPQDQIFGRVEKVFLDKNRHLYLVISPSDSSTRTTWAWLAGQLIQTVETTARSLRVNLSLTEVERLPIYKPPSQTPSSDDSNLKDGSRVLEEYNIPLLEEKLAVKRNKHKIGEIVVRKEIETYIAQVPLKREKLIVEQVGSETQQLATIDLGQEEIVGVEYRAVEEGEGASTLRSEFTSYQAASEALAAIAALHQSDGGERVRVELSVENRELQEKYKTILDRFARVES